MNTLENIKLQNNLYRKKANQIVPQSSNSLDYASSGNQGPGGGTGQTGATNPPAIAVAPGTIITSAIWQTSNSSNRIELTPDDLFTVYKNGNVKVQISSGGIDYEGIRQPVISWGEANGITGFWVLTPNNITFTKNSVGNYTFTHNFGTSVYIVLLTPTSGHFRGQVSNKTSTSFDVTFQQSDYSAGLYTGESPVDVIFEIEIIKISQ